MIDFFRKSDDSEPAMSDSDSNESVPPTSQEVCSWSVGVTSRNEVALTVNHGGSYNSITLYMSSAHARTMIRLLEAALVDLEDIS
jgi:hypothetical protein